MSILTDRLCKSCDTTKQVSEFPQGASQNKCKECRAAARTNWYQRMTIEERRAYEHRNGLWKRYRLRPEQYAELIKDGCAICGTHEDLCVDHDHSCCPGSRTCGKCIRGALCKKHNRGEACFDNTDEIMELLAYRLRYDKERTK